MDTQATPTQAKNNPVSKNIKFDTVDKEPGQIVMSADGNISVQQQIITEVNQVMDMEKMETLKFMEEPVTVRLATSSNPEDLKTESLTINNTKFSFVRGLNKTVPRYVVDRLLRLRPMTYRSEESFDPVHGKQSVQVPTISMKYEFSIVQDANPRGDEWRLAVMSEVS